MSNIGTDLRKILKELELSYGELIIKRDELQSAAEEQLLARSTEFQEWMKSVQSMEIDVIDIMAEASQFRHRCRLCAWSPWGCWTNHEFGKRAMENIKAVRDLSSKRNLIIQARRSPFRGLIMPEKMIYGPESYFNSVMCFLQEDKAGIMGLYGMGGVGKTTLLKKINNHFCTSHGFDCVLWVSVSSKPSIRQIQRNIGGRIGLAWEESRDMRDCAQDIFKVLSTMKYLLLLDDIWEAIDFKAIGFPDPHGRYKSKIVFTTRSEIICGMMQADKKLRIECLSWDEAWTLFQNKVGGDTLESHPQIPLLAKEIAKACAGLPLMLIVIGRAMSLKKTPQEWKHAIMMLNKYTAEFSGVEDMVFSTLKFSYDNLPNESMKLCFLFSSLYPEGHEFDVENLIQQWIGQGFIPVSDNFDEASYCGHGILGTLRGFCLLDSQDNYVKMPELIRGMAHWIACECGERSGKILVTAGEEFTKAPDPRKWGQAERMSVMHTHITELADIPESPYLLTLLLCGNKYLTRIHDDFFIFMPLLTFLDLSSNIKLEAVPKSIVKLVMLEYLDLSGTSIKEVPQEMKNLRRLRFFFLNCIYSPPKIPIGVIGDLSDLRMLGLSVNSFGDSEDDRLAGIQELGCLARVGSLKIAISNVKELESYLGNDRLVQYTTYLSIDGEQDETKKGLSKLSLSPSSSCTSLGYMSRLRSLRICQCRDMEELVIDGMETGLFYSLEKMILRDLPKLAMSWDMKNGHGSPFMSLHDVCVDGCDFMVNLTWLLRVPTLQTLKVSNCQRMEEIIANDSSACDNIFSHLVLLMLDNLQSLLSICRSALLFPRLKEIVVANCPELRRLPLDLNSAPSNNLQQIAGSSNWWGKLEWEDESIKHRLLPLFTEAPKLT